jgi:YMGG-like Gly-zipper
MKLRAFASLTAAIATLGGCVTPPMGPTVPVMPGANKPFATFQQDDADCRGYASQQIAGGAEAANNRSVTEAIIGTALGAGLGAAVGGGRGAAVGAASGAVVGSAVGSNTGAQAQYSLQQRFNISYAQCMSSKGNSIQGDPYGYPRRRQAYGPPPGYYPPPPPPPGYYPPPPPPGN